jgi:hypothetical protein
LTGQCKSLECWKIVSEWLLFNANSAIFQLYHGENNLIFNDMMMRSALYWTNTQSWIFNSASSQKKTSPRIDLSLHSDTLYWFRSNQSSLILLNGVCFAEKQQIPIHIVTIYRTRGEHAKHYTTDAVVER